MSNYSNSSVMSMKQFAELSYKILLDDNYLNIGVAGRPGGGKSCFSTKFAKEYARIANTHWGFDRLTWSRKELMRWIDGDPKSEIVNGLKKDQLPEYSVIVPDELFAMFFNRNWFDEGQIDSITTLNMCRDRHLILIGNVPTIWELDASFLRRLEFYIYIAKRGQAWVFQQEINPFSKDPWNVNENMKLARRNKLPTSINFVGIIYYDDWTPQEKVEYLKVRNTKRLTAIDSNKSQKKERYSVIKKQRDILIRMLFGIDDKLTNKAVAEHLNISEESVRLARIGN